MVIHSVTPLPYLLPQATEPTMSTLPFAGGFLEGVQGPEGLTISRMISTNPACYLNPALAPGSVYPGTHSPKAKA